MSNLSRLGSVLKNMRVERQESALFKKLAGYGNSGMFNYATNKKYDRKALIARDSKIWLDYDKTNLNLMMSCVPKNAFEELITMTEQGKLWHYPIDNEQGLAEKSVPFEEHIFLDSALEEFPQNEYVQNFMSIVVSGLARNHWMTVDRKREIIKFFKEYFEEKAPVYKEAGFEL